MKKLRIAMVASPWLKIPPAGYGGLEYVVHYLAIELKKMGHQVELFSTKDTTTPVFKNHWYYSDGQYRHIHKLLYEAVTLPITHVMYALRHIRDGDFDVIHDHNGFIGPAIMSELDPRHFPPVVHTLHGPFSTDDMVAKGMPDNRPMYTQFIDTGRMHFIGISEAQISFAPEHLRPLMMDVVYNAVNLDDFPFIDKDDKSDYFITLARFTRDKGQALAAKIAEELGIKLRMAGPVNGVTSARDLMVEMANVSSPYRNNADFAYFRHEVLPHLIPGQIDYVGNVAGETKQRFVGRAKALLFPIDWEEPFGVSVIEAGACGTPVVAMNRGSMPELIEHGVNGFLAKNETEFKEYIAKVDEIDPAACRRHVEKHFSAPVMAQKYVERYLQAIEKNARVKD